VHSQNRSCSVFSTTMPRWSETYRPHRSPICCHPPACHGMTCLETSLCGIIDKPIRDTSPAAEVKTPKVTYRQVHSSWQRLPQAQMVCWQRFDGHANLNVGVNQVRERRFLFLIKCAMRWCRCIHRDRKAPQRTVIILPHTRSVGRSPWGCRHAKSAGAESLQQMGSVSAFRSKNKTWK
jgi:hypothetical protein